jgi:methanethiol S-methyltransferase
MKYYLLAFSWIIYCILHSWLISKSMTDYLQQRLGNIYRFYRLFYNIFSIVTLIPVMIYSQSIRQEPFFIWPDYLLPLKYILLLTGIFLFVAGARQYSLAQFSGWAQIKEKTNSQLINDTGVLSSAGILGVVRHPFYAGIFPLIWASDLDITTLIANVILSIYVFVGTLLEERKLIAEFGNSYLEYQKKVSMLFPLQWIKQKLGFTTACFSNII